MSTRDNRSALLICHSWRSIRSSSAGEERLSLHAPNAKPGDEDFHGLGAAGFLAGEEVVVISRERYERLLALEQLL